MFSFHLLFATIYIYIYIYIYTFIFQPRGKNASPHLNTGQLLNGKFRVEKMIGSGGFGQIYKASDESTKLSVAIKVVPSDHEPGRM